MIRVRRPATVPRHLTTNGAAKSAALCQTIAAGAIEVEVDRSILRHRTVQTTLRTAQHGKCCYCESKLRSADVEHFRPVQSTRQTRAIKSRKKPGYYWLAYEWQNLLWACRDCNEYRKNDLFPLVDATRRARFSGEEAHEVALLIDPASEDPEQHLTFHAEEILPLDARGRETIDVLGLDREDITGQRREEYGKLRLLYDAYRTLRAAGGYADLEAKIAGELHRLVADSAEYAAMARAALHAWGLLSPS